MKKFLPIFFCAVMLISMCINVSAADTALNAGTAPYTAATLKLDGVKDAAYSKALAIDASINNSTKQKDGATLTAYVTYSADALWVLVEAKDSTLEKKLGNEKKPDYKVDSIELMLDIDNKGENIPDVTPWQMRCDSYSKLSARKGQKGTSLFLRASEGGDIDFFDAVSVKSADGFVAEYRIPISGLKAGKKIGINVCYNDWDNGENRKMLSSTIGVSSWKAEQYDYIVLGEIPAVTSDPAKSPVTADFSTFAVVSMLGSAMAAVLLRRFVRSSAK